MSLTKRELCKIIMQLRSQQIMEYKAFDYIDCIDLTGKASYIQIPTSACIAYERNWNSDELNKTRHALVHLYCGKELSQLDHFAYERAITYLSHIAEDSRELIHKLRDYSEKLA